MHDACAEDDFFAGVDFPVHAAAVGVDASGTGAVVEEDSHGLCHGIDC